MSTTNQLQSERLALDVEAVAWLLDVSARHVWALNSSGRMPSAVRLGRSVRWRANEIREWLEAGCPTRERWEQLRGQRPGGRPMTGTTVGRAREYVRRGWCVVPIPRRSKAPVIPAWQNLRLTEAELPERFSNGCNVGVLLGEPSGGLVDIDLDSPDAVALADVFLPPTGAVFGRAGKHGSHRLYMVTGNRIGTQQFRGIDGAMLVELRSTGVQTVFPGSVHPSGEPVEWHNVGEPKPIDAEQLAAAVRTLAAAVLLARHWPAVGARHDAAMALAGGLLRSNRIPQDEVEGFIRAVAEAAGDSEPDDRARTAASTASRMSAGGRATGWTRLAELLAGDGEAVVRRVREFLRDDALRADCAATRAAAALLPRNPRTGNHPHPSASANGSPTPHVDSNDRADELMSLASIAALLDLRTRTLERRIAAGHFPQPDLRLFNRYRRWRRATVDAWIAAQQAAKP